jgi:putative acetyltransferase
MDGVEIVLYTDMFRDDFKRLNLVWIEQYFVVEPHDLEQLEEPETHVIASGGAILMAIFQGQVVGCCALIQTAPRVYELAKMAVNTSVQGKGIGQKLGEKAISWAQERSAERLWLESNRRLESALRLYERLGFREVPMAETPYVRADIKMELDLSASDSIKG